MKLAKSLRLFGLALTSLLVILALGIIQPLLTATPTQAQPVVALRRVDPVAIATQIYQRYPELPRENQYISRSSNTIANDDTLLSRFVRYHLYVKDRPANFRFDWKLSMADYLDAFETVSPNNYPSADRLTENPTHGDKAAISSLSREQRNQVVQTLYDIFIGNASTAVDAAPTPSAAPEIPAAEPGAADLL